MAVHVGTEKFQVMFEALGDPRRFEMFSKLVSGESREWCVSEFAKQFDVSVSAASQQLANLEEAGLICRVRDGRKTCYELCDSEDVGRLVSLIS